MTTFYCQTDVFPGNTWKLLWGKASTPELPLCHLMTIVMCGVTEFSTIGHASTRNISLVMEDKIILQYSKSLRRNSGCARGLIKVAKWFWFIL